MAEPRDRIVQRVVEALSSDDPAALVRAHFDQDRAAVVEAVRMTLEATGERPDQGRLEEIVDRELIDELRLPARLPGGVLPALWVHRGAWAAGAVSILLALAGLLLLL